jgi:hypothetical protein
VWAYGLATFACGSRLVPGALDECARCFAENARLTSRLQELAVRVGQLEAELATQFGERHGAREGSLLHLIVAFA